MKKGDKIGRYSILQDFSTAGGGLSKWSFASKDGKEYFIKEFLSPKYPLDDSPGSPVTKAKKRESCTIFELRHKKLMAALKGRGTEGGNLVITLDFFRHRTTYYKITSKVDVTSLSVEEISRLPLENRVLILKTCAHSLGILHAEKIVHGDLKPENILIKKTKTNDFTTKLIDFDDSYLSGEAPEAPDEIVGTMNFYSPEVASYIMKTGIVSTSDLTVQSDIFALGLLYSLYLTGKMPLFPLKYQYPCLAVLSGEKLSLVKSDLPEPLTTLICQMLEGVPNKRPTITQVFSQLKSYDKEPPITTSTSTSTTGALKINMAKPKMESTPELKPAGSLRINMPAKKK